MAQKKYYRNKNNNKENYVVPDAPQAILDMPVEDAGFHPKTLEVFAKGNIRTICDVASRTVRQLFKLQGFNKKSLADCQKVLAKFGLTIVDDTAPAGTAEKPDHSAKESELGESNASKTTKKKTRPSKDYTPPVSAEVLAIEIVESEIISARTVAALAHRKIVRVGDLAKLTTKDLYFMRNLGRSGNAECVAYLASFGLTPWPLEEYEVEVVEVENAPQPKERNGHTGGEKQQPKTKPQPENTSRNGAVATPTEPRQRGEQRHDDRRKNGSDRDTNQSALQERREDRAQQRDRQRSQDTATRGDRGGRKNLPEEPLPEMRKYCSAGKYGYKNAAGEVVIPPMYDEISAFHEGLAAVEVSEQFGYIDESNNMVIEPQYECAMSFSEGLACVTRYGKCGYINKEGQIVIPFKYDAGTMFENGSARVKLDNRWGELTLDGEVRWIK